MARHLASGGIPEGPSDGVLRDQTVLVQGDRIIRVGPAGEVEVPAAATRIDGDGRYLPGVSRETGDPMVQIAAEVGLTFGGHVPAEVGIEDAIETGVSTVDHMDGYPEAALDDATRAAAERGESVTLDDMVRHLDEDRMRVLARLTREAGVYVVPTQYLWANLYGSPDADAALRQPEMNYVSPQQGQAWHNQAAGGPTLDPLTRDLLLEGRDRMLEILVSGTRVVGRYVADEPGQDGAFGTVVPGQRADLVLLEAHLLEDLEHLTERAGVMVRGRWLDREFLDARLEALDGKYPDVG